jgi:hypothetical protein
MPTESELRSLFRDKPEEFYKRNATDVLPRPTETRKADLQHNHPGAPAIVERDDRHGSLAEAQAQAEYPKRVLVRVTSIRHNLLDEDNLCEKVHIDCLRYSGVISGDDPGKAKIEVCQEKAEPGAGEEIRIEVFEI